MVVLAAGAVVAQEEFGHVNGAGVERLEVVPNEMRMSVGLQVKGPTMEEAISAYKAKRESVTKLLAEAGAAPESIKIGDPEAGGGAQPRNAQMQRMIAARRAASGAKTEKGEEPQTISFNAVATWKLAGGSIEELLPETSALEKKIGAIDFVEKEAATPEEAEEMEEEGYSDETAMYGEQAPPGPGKPTFSYARKIDAEQVTGMEKAAYQKAVKSAGEVAALVGREIGALTSVSVNVDAGRPSESYDYYERQMYASMMMNMGYLEESEGGPETVAVGPRLAKLTVTVRVMVGHNLK